MFNRGFGIELESEYGENVDKQDFAPTWWNEADSVDFKLNDEAIVKSGSSRMNRKARAGIMKPTGSTSADADLQQLTWYFHGYLDNYKHTTGSNGKHIHEFWGGEEKELPSFRGIAVFDMLIKYLYGLVEDKLKLEVSDSSMTVSADWIYKTEKAGIIGEGDTFIRPDSLLHEDLFIMFYDVSLKLNNLPLDGVSTSFSFEGNNNHDVDSTIGLGSRYPQKKAQAGKRENNISITTTLTTDTVRSILDAQYGEVNALEPSTCKILNLPLELNIAHCEESELSCKILFPSCTLRVEYDMSGADTIEATITLDTLGTGAVTLNNNTDSIYTDMYVKLVNNQHAIESNKNISFNELEDFLYNSQYVTVENTSNGILVTNTDTVTGRVYSANKPLTSTNTHDWEAPYTIECDIVSTSGDEIRLQLFESNSLYVSQKLTDLGIENGGHVKLTYDGETAKYYVNNSSTAAYSQEIDFESPIEIRFFLTGGASFKYSNFTISQV